MQLAVLVVLKRTKIDSAKWVYLIYGLISNTAPALVPWTSGKKDSQA